MFLNISSGPATLLKKRLWHRCFRVNFTKIPRTLFLQNDYGRLLLNKIKIQDSGKIHVILVLAYPFESITSSDIVCPYLSTLIGKHFLVSEFFELSLATIITVLTPVSCSYVTSFNFDDKKARDVGLTLLLFEQYYDW